MDTHFGLQRVFFLPVQRGRANSAELMQTHGFWLCKQAEVHIPCTSEVIVKILLGILPNKCSVLCYCSFYLPSHSLWHPGTEKMRSQYSWIHTWWEGKVQGEKMFLFKDALVLPCHPKKTPKKSIELKSGIWEEVFKNKNSKLTLQ